MYFKECSDNQVWLSGLTTPTIGGREVPPQGVCDVFIYPGIGPDFGSSILLDTLLCPPHPCRPIAARPEPELSSAPSSYSYHPQFYMVACDVG